MTPRAAGQRGSKPWIREPTDEDSSNESSENTECTSSCESVKEVRPVSPSPSSSQERRSKRDRDEYRTPPCGRRRSRPASGTPSSSSSSWTDASTSSTEFSDTSSITSLDDVTETGGSLASSPSSSSTSLALSPASSLSTSSTSLSSGQLSTRPPPHKRPRGRWFPGRRRRNPGRSVSEQGEDPSDGDETENSEANARTASQLESRLREMEHALKCAICFSRRRDVAFLCGHAACSSCATGIRTCHICRRPIKKRIRLY